MAASSDVHRNLVQLFLEHGVFSESTLLDLLAQCIDAFPIDARRHNIRLTGSDTDKETLDRVAKLEISELLEPLAMKVAKRRYGVDKQMYYGLINLRNDSFAKLSNNLSEKELEFFHAILREVSSEGGSAFITEADALSLIPSLKLLPRISDKDAKACIMKLVAGKWLCSKEDGLGAGIRYELQRMYEGAPAAASSSQGCDN
ncbi:hypothetical protein AB1Y20_006402 [Prymnesium parvum]|uniref:Non-structural maintenance of chromosomes element 1 homolog n=1 Tax=Prymnesium parvum TaxID=97485 RepID=A0AB34J281_PRYPA